MRKQLKRAIRTLTPYEKLMMAREVMWSMQQMKQHQIDTEPEEEIWKDHMWQLVGADELLMLDEESWNNGYEKEITVNEMIDVENGRMKK
mgnify:CR=1 FL=1